MVDTVRALIIKNKKILLVSSSTGRRFWTPGGHRIRDESDRQTLKRELMEELNVKLKSMRFVLSDVIKTRKERGHKSYYYLCRIEGRPTPRNEISRHKWFDANGVRRNYKDWKKEKLVEKLITYLR
jgi:ADP-ribose pyrophosphatase YjhB (NUDIX family)